ncbi:T3SS structure protein EscR [Escherichia coli]|uniref:T3SS structure protein EscR n=1 Tax=Escherichia coli TaxID=562 RepID=A0A376UH98_ECOLX|nr:T3SS structure protein EscR [Escherichia coli]
MSQLMTIGSQPIFLIIVFFLLSLLPIFVVIGTSFLKISIVLGILKNALGIQQVPPNMALTFSIFDTDNVYYVSDNITDK